MENKDLTEEQLLKDITQIIDYFNQLNFINCQKSADMNDPDGIYRLGYCYEYGIEVEKDESKAFIYYQKSADMNNSNGMYKVGYCYYLGIGVEVDKHKAFTYYLKSAEAGNTMGIFKTIICYTFGIGVKEDVYKANEWFENNSEYGKCEYCNENNTNKAWCLSCDPDIATQWTSRNKDIDDLVKSFQLRAMAYEDAIEWIPFDRLFDVKEIGKGGFGSIYRAIWSDGIRKVNKIDSNDDKDDSSDDENHIYKRSREQNSIVALKTLSGSKTSQNLFDFLSEFKNHMTCIILGSELKIYGLTHNSKTNEYLMVFQYANDGNIRKFLRSNFNRLTWELKLKQLRDISKDLNQIHIVGYIHADFHSGNILHDKGTSYVSDLGLSKKVSENNVEGDIYGVMPYVAPEVLSGEEQATKAADIYGFGVIMAEITTGQRPFDGHEFDTKLAVKICKGLRPKFAPGTPDCYVKLANKCMNSDPQKRPKAWDIYYKINDWLEKLGSDYAVERDRNYSDDDSDDENEIKKQFLNADEVVKTLPIITQNHPDHMYTSKIISTKQISSAIKELSLATEPVDILADEYHDP